MCEYGHNPRNITVNELKWTKAGSVIFTLHQISNILTILMTSIYTEMRTHIMLRVLWQTKKESPSFDKNNNCHSGNSTKWMFDVFVRMATYQKIIIFASGPMCQRNSCVNAVFSVFHFSSHSTCYLIFPVIFVVIAVSEWVSKTVRNICITLPMSISLNDIGILAFHIAHKCMNYKIREFVPHR